MDRSIRCAADTAIEKPAPKDMSHHFSDVTKARKPNEMKRFYKFFSIPGIGNLAGGTYSHVLQWQF
jgi:hypothetical protein